MLFKSQKDYQTPPPRIADRVLKTEGLHDIQRPLSQEAADVQARIHDRVVRKRKRKLPMPRPSRSSRDGSAAPGFPPKWSSIGELSQFPLHTLERVWAVSAMSSEVEASEHRAPSQFPGMQWGPARS